jgi:hypothetical protein
MDLYKNGLDLKYMKRQVAEFMKDLELYPRFIEELCDLKYL